MSKPKANGVRRCAEWLGICLSLGWAQSDLGWLEALWWKHHDEHGQLKTGSKP